MSLYASHAFDHRHAGPAVAAPVFNVGATIQAPIISSKDDQYHGSKGDLHRGKIGNYPIPAYAYGAQGAVRATNVAMRTTYDRYYGGYGHWGGQGGTAHNAGYNHGIPYAAPHPSQIAGGYAPTITNKVGQAKAPIESTLPYGGAPLASHPFGGPNAGPAPAMPQGYGGFGFPGAYPHPGLKGYPHW